MQTVNQNSQNDTQVFVNIIKKKSKLLYRWHSKEIHKLARDISPAYRDFVNKLLSNNKLKISRYTGGECQSLEVGDVSSLAKRSKNQIRINFNGCRTFGHELGHSVDMLFGCLCPLSSNVIIYDDKTLYDVFKEEFEAHHKELYEFLMNEYRNNIDSNIHKGAYDIFINNMEKYLTLCKTKEPKTRKRLQKELYECGFVEVYYQIKTKKCFKVLEQKYIPIMDALSSIYDITGLFLLGHSLDYYSRHDERPVSEFFANVFADKIAGNHTRYDSLIKLMPRSFDAFEKLFVLIYDRIQNGKRFTDLKLKEIPESEPGDYEDEEDIEDSSSLKEA